MKIVIDATAAVSGGKVYLNRMLPRLFRIGGEDEFIVFYTDDPDQLELPVGSERVELRRVSIPDYGGWLGQSAMKFLWRLLIFPLSLSKIGPDLLFSNAGFAPPLNFVGFKKVIAVHNSMPLRDELIREERSLVRRRRLIELRRFMGTALRRCDGSIVFSEDTKRRIKECFEGLRHEPSVVYHGIDWGIAERSNRDSPGIPQPYLLFVSQFHRYKNILRLVEAFALIAVNRHDLMLVLVGDAADSGYWEEIETKIAQLNLSGRVKHLPFCPRESLIAIYGGALVFVHPSLAETCSFPLLEAMALGVPVAAARASALPEIAGDAALYFDPLDPTDIAAKLQELISDERLRKDLSEKGIRRSEDFSWDKAAQKTMDVFRQVCERDMDVILSDGGGDNDKLSTPAQKITPDSGFEGPRSRDQA